MHYLLNCQLSFSPTSCRTSQSLQTSSSPLPSPYDNAHNTIFGTPAIAVHDPKHLVDAVGSADGDCLLPIQIVNFSVLGKENARVFLFHIVSLGRVILSAEIRDAVKTSVGVAGDVDHDSPPMQKAILLNIFLETPHNLILQSDIVHLDFRLRSYMQFYHSC